jgi:hypothetical protein
MEEKKKSREEELGHYDLWRKLGSCFEFPINPPHIT